MNIDSDYELSSSDDLDFTCDDSSGDLENDVADFELDTSPSEEKKSKHCNKRNFNAKRKIEQLKEERLFRKFDDSYYDDWD